MQRARSQNIKDQYNKIVICTASDQTAMESIVSAQQGLRTAHDLVQQLNIAGLKIYSILLSRAPKVLNSVHLFLNVTSPHMLIKRGFIQINLDLLHFLSCV